MKIAIWILATLAALSPLLWFVFQRLRASRADKTGTVLYATIRDFEPTKVFGKVSDIVKIKLWLQETGHSGREVSLQTRLPAGQKIQIGMMLPVVIDPNDPNKVYPASEKSVARIQHTGSRAMRRQMKKQKL